MNYIYADAYKLLIAKEEKRTLLWAALALVISSTAQLVQPLFFGKIVEVCSEGDKSDSLKKLTQLSVLLFIITLVGSIATSIRGYLYCLVGERLVRNIRKKLFDSLMHQDISFFDVNKTGELMNRLSSDTAVIQSVLSTNISMGLRAIALIVVSAVLLFITSWKLSFVMMGVVPILAAVINVYGRFTKTLTKQYQDALASASDRGTESISNIRIVRSFGGELFEMWRYSESIFTSYRLGSKRASAYGLFAGSIMFVANNAILVVIFYGATLVLNNELGVGSLTTFILYTIYIALGLGLFGELYTQLMNGVGASQRIFEIINTPSKIPIVGGHWPDSCHGNISFDEVSFKYPTREDVTVLQDFALTIKPNQKVALVGSSGSGTYNISCVNLNIHFYITL